MKRDRRAAPVEMPELLVRPSLSHFEESVRLEESDDFPRLEDRDAV